MLKNIKISFAEFWKLYAILMISLTIVGGFKFYAPVPFMDMWNGYLDFYLLTLKGDTGVWWSQHNEHRILLPRILYWLDIKYFDGLSYFLTIVNFALLGLIALFLYKIFNQNLSNFNDSQIKKSLGYFLLAWIFSWVQKDNLLWGFQSAFLLVQLLPIIMLYCFYKSNTQNKNSWRNFVLGCIVGACASGTMASGVLALPMGVCYLVLTKQRPLKIIVVTILSGLISLIYFNNYSAPPGHGSVLDALRTNPAGLVEYYLLYIGNPFYFLIGQSYFSRAVALEFSIFFVILFLIACINNLRSTVKDGLSMILISFIFLVHLTALATAGGRLAFGVEQVFTSRYTTPSLLAWASLLILFSPKICGWFSNRVRVFNLALLTLAIPFALYQIQVLTVRNYKFDQNLAALALELGVKDQEVIKSLFPLIDLTLKISKDSKEKKISFFGAEPYVDLNKKIGSKKNLNQILSECKGYVDLISPITNESEYLNVSGWKQPASDDRGVIILPVLNQDDLIIGFILGGEKRDDLKKNVGHSYHYAGFKGYISRPLLEASSLIAIEDGSCKLTKVLHN